MLNNNSLMDEVIPLEFFLSQNYPNPFKETTVIKYCVAYKTRVQITVYNSEGELIEKLVDEEKQPGTYEIKFSSLLDHSGNVRNLSNGYYFYRMFAGDYSSDKKWLCINNLLRSNTMKTFLQTLFFFLLVTQICYAQWYQQSSGTTLDLNDINFSSENKVFMFGGWVKGHGGNFWGEQTLFATSNGGSEWDTTLVIYYPHLYSSCYLQNDSVGFVIHENYTWSSVCAILKTTNFGDSWIDVTPDSGFIGGDISFQNDMTGWMVGDKIYKTTDSGNSWYVDYTDSLEDFFLTSISVTPTTVWAVGEGIILKYTSQTGWIKQTSITDFWSHKVVFRDENNGWIAGLTPLMSGYPTILLRTNDGGLTWYSIPNVLYVIEDIEFIDNNLGWAIGYDSTGIGGILKTTNGGEIWEIEVGNLTSKLNAFCIKNNYGWAVGENGLILRTTNAGLTWVANDDQKLPAEFILEQNYPNPFNPSTKIKYSIPQSSNVVIKVYDILGNELETLVNEEKPTGTYEITWYADGVSAKGGYASGVYFYQLRAGSFVETKKMLLLK